MPKDNDGLEMNAAIFAEVGKLIRRKGYSAVVRTEGRTYYKRRRDGHALMIERDADGLSTLVILDDQQ